VQTIEQKNLTCCQAGAPVIGTSGNRSSENSLRKRGRGKNF
jgi:hypothetical protein